MSAEAFLGLGGNLGDPAATMAAALRALDARADTAVGAVSALYRTPPWGKLDQPPFLNAAARVRTTLGPPELLAACLAVERDLKRVRLERWGPRLIDIDILLFGDEAVNEPGLVVPHPRLTERAFVLAPLAEIAPGLVVDGRAVTAWLGEADQAGIERRAGEPDWWRVG